LCHEAQSLILQHEEAGGEASSLQNIKSLKERSCSGKLRHFQNNNKTEIYKSVKRSFLNAQNEKGVFSQQFVSPRKICTTCENKGSSV
jgi:hypothetical protein